MISINVGIDLFRGEIKLGWGVMGQFWGEISGKGEFETIFEL